MHVDASRLYEHVAGDVEAARILLGANGIVVFDDYRSVHTPGVAAVVWEAVLNKGLNPICVSESKLYGTWSEAGPVQDELYTDGRWPGETGRQEDSDECGDPDRRTQAGGRLGAPTAC